MEMSMLLALVLPTLALGRPSVGEVSLDTRQQASLNWTTEYSTQCKHCPYTLCNNIVNPYGEESVILTCWTEGELVGDTELWLKTTNDCYLSEYDLLEYTGDFRTDLEYCGEVPMELTEQDATVRYLSECKWSYSTSSVSYAFYGRDQDVTLTCWAEGGDVMDNYFWYKTLDGCHVSGSGLWGTPDHSQLDNCGPSPWPYINETARSVERSVDDDNEVSAVIRDVNDESDASLLRRWLQPEMIGEEYAPCYTCPTYNTNSTCRIKKQYEYNQTVVSQCLTHEYVEYPNGTAADHKWMLTTDWCYVENYYFWVPPYDYYRYPRCDNWEGY